MPTTAAPRLASFQLLSFEKFLCAPVGVETNGMTLTVMSAFARLDLDPWEKTSQLVALTRPAAIAALRDIVSRVPTLALKSDEPLTTAERLAGLLPTAVKASSLTVKPATFLKRTWYLRLLVACFVVFLCWKAAAMLPF